MNIPLYIIDAFTDKVFGGNPAAVCLLDKWLDSALLQKIAAENNLSETAFVVKISENSYDLKWFTPATEVDLCGHATLASAYVIFNYLGFTHEEINFHTKSGILKIRRNKELLSMDFPARKPQPAVPPKELLEGLGATPQKVLKSRDYMAVFASEKEIIAIKPDFDMLTKVESLGVIVTAKGEKPDFVYTKAEDQINF